MNPESDNTFGLKTMHWRKKTIQHQNPHCALGVEKGVTLGS